MPPGDNDTSGKSREEEKAKLERSAVDYLAGEEDEAKVSDEDTGEVSDRKHDQEKEHPHDHGGIFGGNTELIFSLICGSLLAVGFGLSYVSAVPAWISLVLYMGAYFFGGYYIVMEAYSEVKGGSFEIDFLMIVAATGAAILGEWAEGALLLLLVSLGHSFGDSAMGRAR